MISANSNYKYLILIAFSAIVFLPSNMLPLAYLLLCCVQLKYSDIITIYIHLIGIGVALFYILLGIGDIRLVLPFLVLGGIIGNAKKIEYEYIGFAYYIWITGILALSLGMIYSPVGVDISSYYPDDNASSFIYDINDHESFRYGSIYYNPNQLAFLALGLFGAIASYKKLRMRDYFLPMVIIMVTGSRTFLLYLAIIFSMNYNYKNKYNTLLIFVGCVFFLISNITELIPNRILSTSGNIIEHALFKFTLLGNIYEGKSYLNILFGSGNIDVFHSDSDLGYVIGYYGIPLGVAFILIFLYFSFRKLPKPFFLAILVGSVYGTILTNTRVALLFCLICICLQQKIVSKTKIVCS